MKLKQYLPAFLGSATLLAATPGLAINDSIRINYAVQPKLLDTQFIPSDKDELTEARFNSGLGLTLTNTLFNLSLDYALKGKLQNESNTEQSSLSQVVTADMRSAVINDVFAIDARVKANSIFTQGRDTYHYTVTPVITKSLYNLADLNLQYNYKLDKPSPAGVAEEIKGYSFDLNGELDRGRLTWNGGYTEASTIKDQLLLTESTDTISFKTRYRIVPEMHLELSNSIKNRSLPEDEGSAGQTFSERAYGAGISWAPSEQYSFALNVNKVNNTQNDQVEYFGSGNVTWQPQQHLEFSLGYGNQKLHGVRGLIFSTKIDLDKS